MAFWLLFRERYRERSRNYSHILQSRFQNPRRILREIGKSLLFFSKNRDFMQPKKQAFYEKKREEKSNPISMFSGAF